jgi:glycosyltransferase involved in cell wall biosynthesis
MQIVLISSFYPPVLSGTELQAQSLARELDCLGVRVTILTRPHKGADVHERDRIVQIFRTLQALPVGPPWGITYMLNTHRWLRRLAGKWDLIHGQQVGLHSWPSLRAARALGKPCLMRCSSFGYGGDIATLRAHRFGRHFVKQLQGAARVVALTPAGADEILRYDVPAEKVRVIPNGVDLQRFCAQNWPHMAESEAMRLLFVGRLAPEKGLDVLLEALARLQGHTRFTLRVVGTGDQQGALQAQAAAGGLGAMVEFCGSRQEVLSHYSGSELVIVPSRFEGMPNVVLEAMACARPVLGTRVNGTTDLIAEGCGGWLVPSNDPRATAHALQRLVQARTNLAAAGLCGRRSVEMSYSIARVASMYLCEYEAMLSEKNLHPLQ